MTDTPRKPLRTGCAEKLSAQGLTLRKSARRDPDATDYGRWSLHNAATGKVVLQGTLQDVEQYLTGR